MERVVKWGFGGQLRFGLVLILFLSVTGCSETGRGQGQTSVRDSMGVRIMDLAAPDEINAEAWAVSPNPVLTLGEVEGEEAFLFARIRGALLLPQGRVAVADGLSNEIRIFDSAGVHLRTAGGEGEGPGEFSSLRDLFPYRGDSIAAVDLRKGTVSIFSAGGDWARTVVPHPGPGNLTGIFVEGALEGGAFLIRAMSQFQSGVLEEGYHRENSIFQVYSPEGAAGPELAELPDWEIETANRDGQSVSFPVEMGRRAVSATVGEEALVGVTDRAEFFRFEQGGELREILRLSIPPVPMTDEIREQWTEHLIKDVENEDEGRLIRQRNRERIWPDSLPVFSDLQSSSEGDLWIRRYVPAFVGGPTQWWVVSPDGSVRARATLPEGFRVEAISGGIILGVAADDLGVERVLKLKLISGGLDDE